MRTISRSAFTTVKTEGAILPADLLQRIAEGRDLEGLRPEDYHLLPSERLNEAVNRAWNRCLGAWTAFQDGRSRLPASDAGTTLTRERWLLILFQELGYGRLPYQGSLSIGPEGDAPRYPISHAWGHAPLHLVTFRQDLDRRDPTSIRPSGGGRSPHSLVQEYLNRAEGSLWGLVSNGLRLRVLRDNASLTRTAFVEFDLEAMLSGQLYSDFALLWLVCHQSRVEAVPASSCWLEKWFQASAAQGVRALETLRGGVQQAIAALGRGFLAHPGNRTLRDSLQKGTLSGQEYYRQLLRLVYRLIFLLVAEERDLLLLPDAPDEARRRYAAFYSVRRLRHMAEALRGGPHADLYRGLRLVIGLLREGFPPLGLPALGSYLFSEHSTPNLDGADLANSALLEAMRALCFTVEGRVRRAVDYRNLGAEELGSVYESLLELHPRLHVEAGAFELEVAAGSERKTTGSYYTPTSLIDCLLDSALEPVVAERLEGVRGREEVRGRGGEGVTVAPSPGHPISPSAEEAILSIKVVDPACGSGHFLIAAAHRLARHLARARTGDEEPAPAELRAALRDVVRYCIHGVDINPMAVELCKVALWMETLDPGKPLSFLDRNIQCGNSLIGATPALLKKGIPDEAFTPIEGDDKAHCGEWRKRNKQQRETRQMSLFAPDLQPWDRIGDLAASMMSLHTGDEDTLDEVRRKQEMYESLVRSSAYRCGRLWADAWCAAFVWKKTKEFAYPITEEVFRNIEHNPFKVSDWMVEEIERLRDQYQFFHWHLAFPHVFRLPAKGDEAENEGAGWSGGFDVVLGNPPWEQLQLNLREFFAVSAPNIAGARHMSARQTEIERLSRSDPALHRAFLEAGRESEANQHFVHTSGLYPLTSYGRLNSAPIFVELARHIQSPRGRLGLIVPTGIATDAFAQFLFQSLIDSFALASFYSFENEELIFPAVHHATRFSLLTAAASNSPVEATDFVFFARQTYHLTDEHRHFSLTPAEIQLLNPKTRTCPVFRSKRDAELTKVVYRRVPVLAIDTDSEEYRAKAWPGLTSAGSSEHYRSLEELLGRGGCLDQDKAVRTKQTRFVPLIEAKQIHQFDPCFSTYAGVPASDMLNGRPQLVEKQRHQSLDLPLPRYWAEQSVVEKMYATKGWEREWSIGIRDVTSATNERTAIACILPRIGMVQPLNGVEVPGALDALWIVGAINSFAFDYIARQKTPSTHLNVTIFSQLPAPELQLGNPFVDLISRNVLELSYVIPSLCSFARDCDHDGPPFRWDEERRFLLRCELDAAYFHLYGIGRDDVDYIMDTFPIVRRKDEAAHGEYRTKRVILEIYDEMRRAMETGEPYRTRLDPPPADPRVTHPAHG